MRPLVFAPLRHGLTVGLHEERALSQNFEQRPILIVPGLDGSGPDHWQSRWEQALPSAERVTQSDWGNPCRADWQESLATALVRRPGALLVAHSLGCALVAHLAGVPIGRTVAGALLVAPADVDRPDLAGGRLASFAPLPLSPLPFPAIVVASANDPYVTLSRARVFAAAWGARLVSIGLKGHINDRSGLGEWTEGLQWLDELRAGVETKIAPHKHV